MQSEAAVPRPVERALERTKRHPWYYELNPLVALDLGVLVIFLIAMLYLLPTGQLANTSFRIQQLENEIRALERTNRLLRAQIAGEANLAEVEKAATERLGMIPARRIHFAAPPPEAARVLQPPPAPSEVDKSYPFRSWLDIVLQQLEVLMTGQGVRDGE
jgi:hypothetical protein